MYLKNKLKGQISKAQKVDNENIKKENELNNKIINQIKTEVIRNQMSNNNQKKKMAEIKNCDIGISILYQVLYSLVDMRLFTIEKVDEDFNPNEIWNNSMKEIFMIDNMNNTWPIANFDHLVNAYDSIYYS